MRAKQWRERQKADPEKWDALKEFERAKYRRYKIQGKRLVKDLSPTKQEELREKWRKKAKSCSC